MRTSVGNKSPGLGGLRRGDQNTFFFHKVASSHRRANLITLAMISLPDDVNVVTNTFKECFLHSSGPHIEEWLTRFPFLDTTQVSNLELPFLEVEIRLSLKEADDNKALGPYGFFFKFAQSFWGGFQKRFN